MTLKVIDKNGQLKTAAVGGGGGAPTTSKYLLQVADAGLPNAQAMGALGTGLVKNTTTTGVQSIATTDDVPSVYKKPARVTSASNVTIAGPGATLDGVTLSNGDRVFLQAQVTQSENGLWTFNGAAAAMTRPTDYASGSTTAAFYGVIVPILAGTTYGGAIWYCATPTAITIDTSGTSWNGLPLSVGFPTVYGKLALASGGTNANLSATGGTGQYLKQSSVGAAITVGTIAAADVPVMVASGASHAAGAAPDPGAAAGSTKFLREDATWAVPVGGTTIYSVADGRLTLTTGTPVPTADVTSATVVYYTPFGGNQIGLYSGSAWNVRTLPEISIKLTDTQNGTTTNASAIVTGLTDTSQFIVGMQVTGTGIAANSTIASIDSATQITMNNNATASGTVALTFKVAPNTMLDKFVFDNAGTPKMEMTAWTNDTTRAVALTLQDGIDVKTGATTRRYVGTVRTTATAGTTADNATTAPGMLYVWNRNHRVRRDFRIVDPAASWTYNVAGTIRQANANANNQIGVVVGMRLEALDIQYACRILIAGGGYFGIVHIGVNSTSTAGESAPGVNKIVATGAPEISAAAVLIHRPATGYSYYAMCEEHGVNNSASTTFYGTGNSALTGVWSC